MSFADVAESAFANGPIALRCMSKFARYFVTISLFSTYFGSCSVYAVIVGDNARQMYLYYTDHEIDIRICILVFMLPLILLSCIRNLKFYAPVSMVANLCMATGLGITIYYFVTDLPALNTRPIMGDISSIPSSIAITIFAIEAIGMVMPLENQMKTPQNFVGAFGVLSQGMTMITFVYILLGFFGYWCFGNATEENITKNLPVNQMFVNIHFMDSISVFSIVFKKKISIDFQ